MKIYATYGLAGAFLGALQTLGLFFLGFHGEKIHLLNSLKVALPLGLLGFVISVAVVVLGIRAWREAAPDKAMSYGRGVGGGCLIGLLQGLGTAVFTLLYGYVINPGLKEAMMANAMAELQRKNVPAEAYAMAQKFMNVTMSPVVQAFGSFVWLAGLALVVALIAAAVLRRSAPAAVLPAV